MALASAVLVSIWVCVLVDQGDTIGLASGKHTKNDGQSSCLMGKSTTNGPEITMFFMETSTISTGPCSIAFCMFTIWLFHIANWTIHEIKGCFFKGKIICKWAMASIATLNKQMVNHDKSLNEYVNS